MFKKLFKMTILALLLTAGTASAQQTVPVSQQACMNNAKPRIMGPVTTSRQAYYAMKRRTALMTHTWIEYLNTYAAEAILASEQKFKKGMAAIDALGLCNNNRYLTDREVADLAERYNGLYKEMTAAGHTFLDHVGVWHAATQLQ